VGCVYHAFGCGVVFKLAHTKGGWRESVVYKFEGEPDGSMSNSGLTLDGKGHVYGTTLNGGAGLNAGEGTVFEVTP